MKKHSFALLLPGLLAVSLSASAWAQTGTPQPAAPLPSMADVRKKAVDSALASSQKEFAAQTEALQGLAQTDSYVDARLNELAVLQAMGEPALARFATDSVQMSFLSLLIRQNARIITLLEAHPKETQAKEAQPKPEAKPEAKPEPKP